MPAEAVFIVFIVFGFGFLTIKTLVSYAKWRGERKAVKEGSLRTSELKQLMREAVDEANAPLHQRIDRLEGLLEEQHRPRLLPLEDEATVRRTSADANGTPAPAQRVT